MFRPFSVEAVLNGYIVTIGCQRVVFTSAETLTIAIQSYLRDPEVAEKHFLREAINARHVTGRVAEPTTVSSTETLWASGVDTTRTVESLHREVEQRAREAAQYRNDAGVTPKELIRR